MSIFIPEEDCLIGTRVRAQVFTRGLCRPRVSPNNARIARPPSPTDPGVSGQVGIPPTVATRKPALQIPQISEGFKGQIRNVLDGDAHMS